MILLEIFIERERSDWWREEWCSGGRRCGWVVDTEHNWDSVRVGGGTRSGTCSGWRGSGGRQRWGVRWRSRLPSLKLGPLSGAQSRV